MRFHVSSYLQTFKKLLPSRVQFVLVRVEESGRFTVLLLVAVNVAIAAVILIPGQGCTMYIQHTERFISLAGSVEYSSDFLCSVILTMYRVSKKVFFLFRALSLSETFLGQTV